MNPIAVGALAPDFTLKDNRGDEVTLSALTGKKVLLSWHPLAWTKVCAEQMKGLEAHYEEFAKLRTVPLGLSVDAYPCKNAWAKELKIASVRLPSDFWPHGGVAKAYGLFLEQEGFSQRANVILDDSGRVAWIRLYAISELPDIREVLDVLKKMQ